jgi:hypothetical protein
MRRLIAGGGVLLASAVVWAFSPQQTSESSAMGVKLFDGGVATLLEKHCVDCHGGAHKEAGFDMTTREGLLRGDDYGAAIVPGKSSESLLIVLVRHAVHAPVEEIATLATTETS